MTEPVKKTPEEIEEIRGLYRALAFHAFLSRGVSDPELARKLSDEYASEMVKDL